MNEFDHLTRYYRHFETEILLIFTEKWAIFDKFFGLHLRVSTIYSYLYGLLNIK